MKQSKRIPRRVASSLVKSLFTIAQRLSQALEYTTSKHTYIDESLNQVNAKFFKQQDTAILDSIIEFHEGLAQKMRNGPITDEAFVTIAKHKDLRVRYVAADTSVGLVITTGCLKRLMELAANICDQTSWVDNTTNLPVYVCETVRNYRDSFQAPHFLRVLDILRFMEETDDDMLEISLKGVARDLKAHDEMFSGYSYNASPMGISRYYPLLSDRYQPDSWKHYLVTLYSGLVNEVCVFTPASPMSRDIALAELNIVKA